MPKKPAVRSKTKSNLSLALDMAELCCHGAASYAPYCAFTPGWLIGYDGIVASGFRVNEELPIAPHTESFRTAVMRAGEPYSLTVMSNNTVVVKGHQFKAAIPTFPLAQMHNVQPDSPLGPMTEGVRNALVEAGKTTTNRSDRVVAASVMLRRMSAVATDGTTILEAAHGGNLPGEWLLPREFVEAFKAVKYMPTHCGWSDETFTVWFGPNAWLRSNVYQEKYPDTDVIFARMLADHSEWRPMPDNMLLALETLKPFLLPGKCVMIAEQGVACCDTEGKVFGASYALEHYIQPQSRPVPWEGLRHAAAHGQWIAWTRDAALWQGQVLRGAVACAE